MAYWDFSPRVAENSTTTGTGAITLAGGISGYQRFGSFASVSDTMHYYIEGNDGTWEFGLGTYSALNTLTRTTVIASSNSNTAVSFTASSLTVFMGWPGLAKVLANVASKTTPVGADMVPLYDSVSGGLQSLSMTNLKTFVGSSGATTGFETNFLLMGA